MSCPRTGTVHSTGLQCSGPVPKVRHQPPAMAELVAISTNWPSFFSCAVSILCQSGVVVPHPVQSTPARADLGQSLTRLAAFFTAAILFIDCQMYCRSFCQWTVCRFDRSVISVGCLAVWGRMHEAPIACL